jgi:phosphomevalonate kinase
MKTPSSETTKYLRQFNQWRRGNMDMEMPNPREVGRAIDAACDRLEHLEQVRLEIRKLVKP